MFDRFTNSARKSMALSRRQALRWGHDFIGTEHMLLALLEMEVVADIFAKLGIEIGDAAQRVESHMTAAPQGKELESSQLPFTPRAKRVLELAMDEAQGLGHDFIDVEHVLLGLIREHEGIAGQVLGGMGVELEKTRTLAAMNLENVRWSQRHLLSPAMALFMVITVPMVGVVFAFVVLEKPYPSVAFGYLALVLLLSFVAWRIRLKQRRQP